MGRKEKKNASTAQATTSGEMKILVNATAPFRTFEVTIGNAAFEEAVKCVRIASEEIGIDLHIHKLQIGEYVKEIKLEDNKLPQNPKVGMTPITVVAKTPDSSYMATLLQIQQDLASTKSEMFKMKQSLIVLADKDIVLLADQIICAAAKYGKKNYKMTNEYETSLSRLTEQNRVQAVLQKWGMDNQSFITLSKDLKKKRNKFAHPTIAEIRMRAQQAQAHLEILNESFATKVVKEYKSFLANMN